MDNKKLLLTCLTVLFIQGGVFAAGNYSYGQAGGSPIYQRENYINDTLSGRTTLKGRVVTVPAGQNFSAVVTTPLSSENLTTGQTVTLALGSDFYYADNLIAPAGSTVTGSVLEVAKAKHGSLNGKLMVRFTQIVTPYGVQIPISALIKTSDNTGLLIGGTKMDVVKDYGKDMVVGTAAGALSGVVFGALAGGNVGRGAALGTAVGAGGGLVKSVWDKGEDVVIPVNSSIDLILTQPITVNPASYNQDY
ncbi:hypothetical protein IJF81_05410 [bacterium]|nr:hypothetical protein [bacterium]